MVRTTYVGDAMTLAQGQVLMHYVRFQMPPAPFALTNVYFNVVDEALRDVPSSEVYLHHATGNPLGGVMPSWNLFCKNPSWVVASGSTNVEQTVASSKAEVRVCDRCHRSPPMVDPPHTHTHRERACGVR